MKIDIKCLREKFSRAYERWMGARIVSSYSIHDNPNEAYTLELSNSAKISLNCIERCYLVNHTSPFSTDRKIRIYQVYGSHSGDVPEVVKEWLDKGFSISPLLPWWSPRSEQKRAAIHAFSSLLVEECKHKKA